MANVGQSSAGLGPRGKPNNRSEYFKNVQKDLNKRFTKKGAKEKTKPTKEK